MAKDAWDEQPLVVRLASIQPGLSSEPYLKLCREAAIEMARLQEIVSKHCGAPIANGSSTNG